LLLEFGDNETVAVVKSARETLSVDAALQQQKKQQEKESDQ
jgi:hypothetical protein